tara:strand:- start:3303 stop:3602 length:300 start_codon:yes stop_codon:yes gene_type:complete
MAVEERRNSLESFCRDITFGFTWEKTPWYDREYLRLMVKDVIGNRNDFEESYDVDNYVLVPKSQKNSWVMKQDPSLSINFIGSHLLNGHKYYFGYAYDN